MSLSEKLFQGQLADMCDLSSFYFSLLSEASDNITNILNFTESYLGILYVLNSLF